jgi:hypothetical protein
VSRLRSSVVLAGAFIGAWSLQAAAWAAGPALRLDGVVGPAAAPIGAAVDVELTGPDVGLVGTGSRLFIVRTDLAGQVRSPTDPRLDPVARAERASSHPPRVTAGFRVPRVGGGRYDLLLDCERCADRNGGSPMVAVGSFTVLTPKLPFWVLGLAALAVGALIIVYSKTVAGTGARPVWAPLERSQRRGGPRRDDAE